MHHCLCLLLHKTSILCESQFLPTSNSHWSQGWDIWRQHKCSSVSGEVSSHSGYLLTLLSSARHQRSQTQSLLPARRQRDPDCHSASNQECCSQIPTLGERRRANPGWLDCQTSYSTRSYSGQGSENDQVPCTGAASSQGTDSKF